MLFINFEFVQLGAEPATTHYVGNNATYQSIQNAIDNASTGDEVLVYNGIYYEHLIISKSITLRGQSKEDTIINGSKDFGEAIYIDADWVNVSDFTITGTGSEWGEAGIELNDVRNCNINNNIITANKFNGIYLLFASQNTIAKNTISWNEGSGIFLDESQGNTIENNDIFPNNSVGLSMGFSNQNQINNNTISFNTLLGIDTWDSSENTFENNVLANNQGNAIEFWGANNNLFSNNEISKNQDEGIHLQGATNNTFKNNQLIEDGFSLDGRSITRWNSHDIDDSNTVNGKSVYYWKDQIGGSVPANAGQVILINCTQVIVESQEITKTSEAIILGFSQNNNIKNNVLNSNQRHGITIWKSNGNNITNNELDSNKEMGISITDANNNTIAGNSISNNKYGIELRSSKYHNFNNNTLTNNGLFLTGNLFDFWRVDDSNKILDDEDNIIWEYSKAYWNTHVIETSNSVDGKPIYYWKNRNSGTISSGAGQVILANCTNIRVEDGNFSFGITGIELGFSSENTIVNNAATTNLRYGIYMETSENNVIINNSVNSNLRNGIHLESSDGNLISNNELTSNTNQGVFLYFSDNNNISNNQISNNKDGISLEMSSKNLFSGNSIKSNSYSGLNITLDCNNNIIYHNNFISNNIQAIDYGTNQWENDYPTGGNYWSEYQVLDLFNGKSQDIDGEDGIGDVPYEIIEALMFASDNYPLIAPVGVGGLQSIPPTAARELEAVAGDGSAALSWKPSAYDGGETITNYNIYIGTTQDNLTLNTSVDAVETAVEYDYKISNLKNGQTYYFTVVAENKVGEGTTSNIAFAIPMVSPVPSAPVNLKAQAGNGNVLLSWSAPASDGGSVIIGYKIYRSTIPGDQTLINVIGDVLGYKDNNASNDITYYYTVSAINRDGEGAKSLEISATPKVGKSENGDDEASLFLYLGILSILIIIIIIILILLTRKRRPKPQNVVTQKERKTSTSKKSDDIVRKKH